MLVFFFAAAWGGAARFGAGLRRVSRFRVAALGAAGTATLGAVLGAASGLCGVLSGLVGLFVAGLFVADLPMPCLGALGAVLLELFALTTALFGLHLLI